MDLVRQLPEISPWTVQANPQSLVELGVWPSLPKNLDILWKSPRYYPGRRVLAVIPTSGVVGSPNFLKYVPGGPQYPSYFCEIVSWDEKSKMFTLAVETADGPKVNVQKDLEHVLLLNHPQEFGKEMLGTNAKLYLEDGIRGNYSCPVTKTKVYEVALEIGDLAAKLDFSKISNTAQAQALVELQQQIVTRLVSCFNITSFASGCDRDRIGRTDNLGLLATNGQAQCHGLSSTTSGFLAVFSELLDREKQKSSMYHLNITLSL